MEIEKILYHTQALHIHIQHIDLTKSQYARLTHIHDEIEFIRVDSGELLVAVNDDLIQLKKGQYMLINRRIPHRISFYKENASCTYIQIDINFYTKFMDVHFETFLPLFLKIFETKSFQIIEENDDICRVYDRIYTEYFCQLPHNDLYIRSYVQNIIAFMHRNSFCFDYGKIYDYTELEKILPAIEYIENNFDQKISLEVVSSKVNVSKYYFCKIFKAILGSTFTEFLALFRIHKAESLLLNTNSKISSIAESCGFDSVQHFNRLFKKYKFCTPAEYRNKKNLT